MKKEESQPQSLMYPVSCAEACKLRGLCQHEAYSSLNFKTQETDMSDMPYLSSRNNFVPAGNSTGHELWRTTSALVGPSMSCNCN